MKQNEIEVYMDDIEKSLIERYGKIRPAVRPMLVFYKDALLRYVDMQDAYEGGNHTGVLLKNIKDTMSILITLSSKLGITSPLDLAKLKKAEAFKEDNDDEPDYLDSLTK